MNFETIKTDFKTRKKHRSGVFQNRVHVSVYLYGFNGMERDDEARGKGNQYQFGDYSYDPRLGRRFNVDPVVYPWQSGYAVFNNNPIYFIDPSGTEAVDGGGDGKTIGKPKIDEPDPDYGVLLPDVNIESKKMGFFERTWNKAKAYAQVHKNLFMAKHDNMFKAIGAIRNFFTLKYQFMIHGHGGGEGGTEASSNRITLVIEFDTFNNLFIFSIGAKDKKTRPNNNPDAPPKTNQPKDVLNDGELQKSGGEHKSKLDNPNNENIVEQTKSSNGMNLPETITIWVHGQEYRNGQVESFVKTIKASNTPRNRKIRDADVSVPESEVEK